MLTNSSLSSIVGGVNSNFSLLNSVLSTFLTLNKYNDATRHIEFVSINAAGLNLNNVFTIGPVGEAPKLTIDVDGILTGNSINVDVSVQRRVRITSFLTDLSEPGIPGEIVYLEPNGVEGEGHFGFYLETGWQKLGGPGGIGGGVSFLYQLNDVNITGTPRDGSPLIFNLAQNKWVNSPYNLNNFFLNLTNLTTYTIPFWNVDKFSDSNTSFNPLNNSLDVNGDFTARTKSFLIDHPSKKDHKLRYGNLEGPEHGVYFRGRNKNKTIILPSYWKDLIDPDSITVNITPIGGIQSIYVSEVTCEYITIEGPQLIDYFFTVFAERVDVPKLEVEIPTTI